MREAVHLTEDNVKRSNFLKFFLKSVESLGEKGSINKGEAKVDVGLPPFKCRVMNFSECLNLLVIVFNREGKGSVCDKFEGRLQDTIYNFLLHF